MRIALKSFETYGIGRTIRSISRNVLATPFVRMQFGEKLLDKMATPVAKVQHELQRF
ncbi:MAG: hypothetical protein ACRCXT_19635 [Paraclostridium sp.]